MECTQRLECTQDLYNSPTEQSCPEQIGFLGICGIKHPVKKGPNKIGRDPQTCSIVLQLESISRQHAVINILNKTEFMLMDLDSANKTKLMDKTLQPYIPHPLKNGDTVQFGKIFGIFRLLEEDNELPMTQALDIPDTPVTNKHVSRIHVPITTIPESPEISDRDDSFIAPSQPKLPKPLKNESNNFIKPAAKTISIQPIGSNKIDNVYWNSSKKSTSIGSTFDESNQSLNDSTISVNKSSMDVHEMETQPPCNNVNNISLDSIYNANTQMPNACDQKTDRESADGIYSANTQMPNAEHHNASIDAIFNANTQLPSTCNQNVSLDSIYTANTQAPDNLKASPSIHSLDTQMPATDNLPNVRIVSNQQEMEFDFCVANKENNISIFNAETQPVLNTSKKSEPLTTANKSSKSNNQTTKSSLHPSEEEILLEDLDESFEDEFESQSLLPETPKKRNKQNQNENKTDPVIKLNKPAKRDDRLSSDSSTDCDDIEIAPTQQLPKPAEDDLTDCEDDNNTKTDNLPKSNNQNEMYEDMLTQVLDDELPKTNNNTNTTPKVPNRLSLATSSKVPFEDMLTQVIEDDQPSHTTAASDQNFEDMPTQVIYNEIEPEKINIEEMQTQVLQEDTSNKVIEIKKVSNDFKSPFKVPLQSPRKAKRKETPKDNKVKEIITVAENTKEVSNISEKDDKYYEATQDILDDLCTQQLSPEVLPIKEDDDVVPCSVEDDKVGEYKLPGLDYDISPKSSDKSSESNIDDKLNQFVSSLSKEQIRDVIGVQPLKKQPSDPSDTEATPKKVHPMKFFEIDLPDSQEIKTSVSLHYKSNVTESSSDSETENDSEEQFTPILYRKKRKTKVNAKLNLTKILDVDALPSRVLTRVRKPALKLQDSEVTDKKIGENLLKPKFLTEQEGEISNEIIIENITRLKSKNEKNKSNTEANINNEELKNESKTDGQPPNKTEQNTTGKLQSGDNKGHTSKTETSSKEKRKLDDNKDNESKIEHSSKDKRKKDDIKDSKIEHSSRDKRKQDDIKKNASKSERSKREKPKASDIKEEKPVSKLSKSKTLDSNLLSIDLTSQRSKRSTRNKNKYKETDKETEKHSVSLETGKDKKGKKDDDKRKKSNNKEDKQESDVKEVRRSRRQKSYKEKKDNDSLIKVKIIKPEKKEVKPVPVQHEKSAVYSVSSDSGTDSPKRLKRSATEALRAPSPKRTRSAANVSSSASSSKSASTANSTTSSLRSTPAKRMETQRVLFTAFPFEEVRNKLESLGAVIVSDVTACTVLVTLHIKRTFKLLCAVGLGRPIVGSAWVQACADNNCIVDPWLYLLKDESAEQRFKFSLQRTLTSKRNFLKGYKVSSTPNVKPTTAEMILIVECSGGVWAEGGPNWLCVSCSADRAQWAALAQRGATLVSSELVLGGVLRQKLDIAASKLA